LGRNYGLRGALADRSFTEGSFITGTTEGDTVGSLLVFGVPHPPFVRGILQWLLRRRKQWQPPTQPLHATLGSPANELLFASEAEYCLLCTRPVLQH
jgi:hypothetical protein